MTDLLFHSRLAVWLGAIILLVQAVTGRGSNFMTFIAVLCLTLGFAAFLGALAVGDRTAERAAPSVATPSPEREEISDRERSPVSSSDQVSIPTDAPAGGPSKP